MKERIREFILGFWAMYQANFIGFQYFCFNCLSSCPVGRQSSA